MTKKEKQNTTYDELEDFLYTNFKKEVKNKDLRIRVSERQKTAIEKMAADREMNISELILCLLQYEKDNNVIYGQIIERKMRRL